MVTDNRILQELRYLNIKYVDYKNPTQPKWFRAPYFPQNIKHIMLHTTASWSDCQYKNVTPEFFLNYFFNQLKWGKPGYKFMIFCDGQVYQFGPLNKDEVLLWEEVTYGASGGYNGNTIHISWVGGYNPRDPMGGILNINRVQADTMFELAKALLTLFPKAVLMGHNQVEVDHKPCPLFSVPKEAIRRGISKDRILFDDPLGYVQKLPDLSGLYNKGILA
jgi:hypothetical protein